MLLIAGSGCHNARHDKKNMKDGSKMMMMRHYFRNDRGMRGMRGMMGQGMRNGMMRGMGRMPIDSTGWMPMAPGRRMLESIPNVTENQKKLIGDLTKKHFDEMKKLREEMSSKMHSLMDSHRKDILNILTDEQKKFIRDSVSYSPVNP